MTLRILLRPFMLASLAVLFGLFLALGASTAHAQLPDLDPDLEDPEAPDDPNGDLLDLGNLLDLDELDLGDLNLQELLELLDVLGLLTEDAPPPPAPAPAPAPVVQPPAPAPVAPAPAQVVQRPVGPVAAGAGGASDTGSATTLPLLALGALTLAGTAAAVTRRPRRSSV